MQGLSTLLDEKLLRIIKILYQNKDSFYHVTKLAQDSGVSSATTLRQIPLLVDSGLVKVSKVGKLKIYSFNNTPENQSFIKTILGEEDING